MDPFNDTDMPPLVIEDNEGKIIFMLRQDGTAWLASPKAAQAAASIFWREVVATADRLGIDMSVVTSLNPTEEKSA